MTDEGSNQNGDGEEPNIVGKKEVEGADHGANQSTNNSVDARMEGFGMC